MYEKSLLHSPWHVEGFDMYVGTVKMKMGERKAQMMSAAAATAAPPAMPERADFARPSRSAYIHTFTQLFIHSFVHSKNTHIYKYIHSYV